MAFALTVVTCTHDPRPDYINRVIEALKLQSLSCEQWEYLLIDNRSTTPIGQSLDLSWHPNARVLREEEIGLTHARLRGISEARGDVIVFVDDDNVLDARYLEKVTEVAREFPILGSWGGQVQPAFDSEPPAWTRPYWSRLVVRTVPADAWSNLPDEERTMPAGAGLCVRRSVAEHYLWLHRSGKRPVTMDRTGKGSVLSGGDIDLARCAPDIGLGLGLFSRLQLIHLIPASRLEEPYLLRLVEGMAYSGVFVESFRGPHMPRTVARHVRLMSLLRLAATDSRRRRFALAARRGQARAERDLARMNEHDSASSSRLDARGA
jgi:hypothetical protein